MSISHHTIKKIIPILSVILCAFSGLSWASGSGANNDFGGRRVLFIGIDGCRPDALSAATTPNIDALMANGVITYDAYAGGELGGVTQQATWSGPGWSSLLTGVWRNKHGVNSNNFSSNNFINYPHFCRRIKEKVPTAYVSSIVQWGSINSIIFSSMINGVNFMDHQVTTADNSAAVGDAAVAHLANQDPDVLFLHFDDVDHAGHALGFSTDVPEYMSAIETVDTQIGRVVAALQARPDYAQEDWLIIVATDHGGHKTNDGKGNHGTQLSVDRKIFILVSGGASANGEVSTQSPGQPAVPATALRHLGIGIDPAWGWEEPSFGLPAPTFSVQGAGKHALLSWSIPAGGVSGLTGFEILRDGVTIANLPANTRSYTDTHSALVSQTTFTYEIRFTGSTELPLNGSVTLGGTPDVASNLEMHLRFDNNSSDSTAHAHNATVVGGAMYVQGRFNQAAVVDANRYFTIPQSGGLRFGSATDFTVGFWMKSTGQWAGDPSFISNKDWDSGSNRGWIVAAQQNGTGWQWNLKGANAGRRDFDSGGTVQDQQWHHILVSHDRNGMASFYKDGKFISTVSISGDGNINTSLPLVIGSDGNQNNNYKFSSAVYMDEVKIWTRALSALDAQEEASADTAYQNWRATHFSTGELNNSQVAGDDADPDHDGMTNLTEFAVGGNPLAPGDAEPLTVEKVGNNYVLSWQQRNGGYGDVGVNYRADGVTYAVAYSYDCITWHGGAAEIVEESAPTFIADGWHRAHATLVNAPDPSKPIFFRLKLVR